MCLPEHYDVTVVGHPRGGVEDEVIGIWKLPRLAGASRMKQQWAPVQRQREQPPAIPRDAVWLSFAEQDGLQHDFFFTVGLVIGG